MKDREAVKRLSQLDQREALIRDLQPTIVAEWAALDDKGRQRVRKELAEQFGHEICNAVIEMASGEGANNGE